MPSSLLSPNLHCALCRLLRQELVCGPASCALELWVERYLLNLKKRSKYKTTKDAEKTFVLHSELTGRSLAECRRLHGCLSVHELHPSMKSLPRQGDGYDPGFGDAAVECHFNFKGDRVSDRTRCTPFPMSVASAREAAYKAVQHAANSGLPGWCALDLDGDVLHNNVVHLFKQCQTPGFVAHSAAGRSSKRSWAATFVEVDCFERRAVCYVRCFVLVRKEHVPGTALAAALRCAVVHRLSNCRERKLPGATCLRARGSNFEAEPFTHVIAVDSLVQPLVVLSADPEGTEDMHFIPFGKHSQMT